MDVEVPPQKTCGTPQHLRQFARLDGCGRIKMRALAEAFPSPRRLAEATLEDFRSVRGITTVMAEKLFAIRTLAPDQVVNNGEVRVTVWNKRTQKRVSGAAAPKASEVDAWLACHAETHERYAGQDEQIKGPDMVPPACQMNETDFEAHWTNEQRLDSANSAFERVPGVVGPYGLRPLALPQAEAEAGNLPEGGTLHFALLQAAACIDGDVDSLHRELEKQVAPSERRPLPMLHVARVTLRRPVWVWTSAEPAGVLLCEGEEEEMDPTQVTPLRVCQLGGYFFALTRTEDCDEVSVTLTPLAGGATAEAELQHELPDLKDAMNSGLADVESQIQAIAKWSKDNLGEEYNVSAAETAVKDLRAQLLNGDGMCAVFLGINGVGKSTICNLLILNSSIDDETYSKGPSDDYVPEALLNLAMGHRARTHAELVKNPEGAGIPDLTVTILTSSPEEAERAAKQHSDTENQIKMYCESGGNKPQLRGFVLPSGDATGSTTALQTRVHYGSVVHLLVEYYSVEELQKEAFSFVQLFNELDSDPMDLNSDEQENVIQGWYTYLNIKDGPYKRADLPLIHQLDMFDLKEEKWEDIKVCDGLREIVKSKKHLYLGSGRHLPLDRLLVHDLIKKMNDKEQLFRYAVKSLATFQPAAVLEGGNGFIDLPGQNDVDSACAAETREGVKEAAVVFVVLAKSLYEDKSSLRLLKESETVKRAAAGEAKVVFMFNREPQSDYKHRELDTASEKQVLEALEKNTRELWHNSLLDANEKARRERYTYKSEEEIKLIAKSTLMGAIYPMLHSSYTLNWECAERHKETEGDLSGSARVFELSNVHWLLGILETLNRQSLTDQLKHIATTELPALRDKLSDSLQDAKNADCGLPDWLVQRVTKFLKSKNSMIEMAANKLSKSIHELKGGGASSSATRPSFRQQLDKLVSEYVTEGEEVANFLRQARQHSDERWARIDKQLKRIRSARAAVNPRNNGTHPGCPLLPLIFGSNAQCVPFSFEPLVAQLQAVLEAMLEAVVDLVIEQVDQLIGSGETAGTAAGGAAGLASIASFKESFVTSEVIRPLQKRFSLHFFVKANQRNLMLIDGKFDEYLRKHAAHLETVALNSRMLRRSFEHASLAGIKTLIKDNREAVREEWQSQLAKEVQRFVDKQFSSLLSDLTSSNKTYSVKKMLTAVLQHIVNTNDLQKDEQLQRDLRGFIEGLGYQTNSLRSLWARLDGPFDPCKLGEASARHLERRRQREQMTRQARGTLKLQSAPKRTLTDVHIDGEDLRQSRPLNVSSISNLFSASDDDKADSMRNSLRSKYSLDVFALDQQEEWTALGLDLFSAAAIVAYDSEALKQCARDPSSPDAELTMKEHVHFAAMQLRALVASQLAYYYRTDERAQKLSFLGEPVTAYVERINLSSGADQYRGDLLCLWALAHFLKSSFRVWIPGRGSVHIPFDNSRRAVSAYQLMLIANPPDGSPPAGHYRSSWIPLHRPRGNIQQSNASRAVGIPQVFAEGALRRTPPAHTPRKRPHPA